MDVLIIFSSVLVAEKPYFGKGLLPRLTICSLCILTLCNFISRFGFEGCFWVLCRAAAVKSLPALIFSADNILLLVL